MTDSDICGVCKGDGTIELIDSQCPFLKSHICQCIFLDRKMCPICEKKCHHDTPHRPKIRISPIN